MRSPCVPLLFAHVDSRHGGAGYIGAHVVRLLQAAGEDVVVADDLSTGQAARKQVDESMTRPAWYYQQNVNGLANVIAAMELSGADRLVFSSSAAVYGDPADVAIAEDAPTVPVNLYGETKLVGEWLVRDAARAGILRGAALRYFNVAGAGWDELSDPAVLNLVTRVLHRLGQGEAPRVFGTDYPTPDGTCVRDFVHVLDVARAHTAALEHLDHLETPSRLAVFNVGTGIGSSVLEVIAALGRITGLDEILRSAWSAWRSRQER